MSGSHEGSGRIRSNPVTPEFVSLGFDIFPYRATYLSDRYIFSGTLLTPLNLHRTRQIRIAVFLCDLLRRATMVDRVPRHLLAAEVKRAGTVKE